MTNDEALKLFKITVDVIENQDARRRKEHMTISF